MFPHHDEASADYVRQSPGELSRHEARSSVALGAAVLLTDETVKVLGEQLWRALAVMELEMNPIAFGGLVMTSSLPSMTTPSKAWGLLSSTV
jgi:hypothetical protein